MHLIEVTPVPCLVCGAGNVPNNHGERKQFVDLERDTYWEDAAIICEDCAQRIGGIVGMRSVDSVRELELHVRRLTQKLHEKDAKYDELRRRIQRHGFDLVEA